MSELWQLYTEEGQPIVGQGATKDEAFAGLLHGAAHVWIWRKKAGNVELLLQKRAANKRTWPGDWDISAAGHINLGEEPIDAAIRETSEEIGLGVAPQDLCLITKTHDRLIAPSGEIENEWRWVYALRLDTEPSFILEKSEVGALSWKNLNIIKDEVLDTSLAKNYVPQGSPYYNQVFAFIEAKAFNI